MTLEEIFEPISEELHVVQHNLGVRLRGMIAQHQRQASQDVLLEQVIAHCLRTSGKGLRPALVLLSANLIRPIAPDHRLYQPLIRLATAVELIHSASLVHDDVLDEAEFRRGQSALNAKAGNKIAVLVGDMLFLQAFALLTDLDLPDWQIKQEIFQVLCHTTQTMCAGEIFQHHLRLEAQTADVDEYLSIATHKTALFMSACCRCGALLLQPGNALVQTLTDFGLNFGLAFQLADDTVDQDALVDHGVDLRPLTHHYIGRAKALLHSANRNLYARHLMALCDLLASRHTA